MLSASHLKGADTLCNSLQGVFWDVGRGSSHFVCFAFMTGKVGSLGWAVPQIWKNS